MRTLIIVAVLLMLFGCAQQVQEQTEYLGYSRGQVSFQYPDWSDAEKTDQNFLVKSNGSCVFGAAEYPILPSRMLKDILEDEFDSRFDGEYIDFAVRSGDHDFDARARMFYCDYNTYTFTIACIDELQEEGLLATAECDERDLDTKDKLGLIPLPPDEDITMLADTFKQARADGADVLYWYFSWKDLDDNWTASDWVLEPMGHEGRIALVVEVIHTTVLGQYPARYDSFTDPGFKEDFADFSVDFVERYQPEYYFIGNEVDIYFDMHRDELNEYEELLSYTRDRIHQTSPGTKVGVVVTYHAALENNATDIIEELSDDVDILGYTTYGHEANFSFGNLSRGIDYLYAIEDVVPGKDFAIVEAGWSTSPMLDSSEDLQEEYAETFFEYLEDTDAEFVNWFSLHDGVDCRKVAESFLTHMPEMMEDEEFMEFFEEFICTLGIKHSDGTPKRAWSVWEENT